MLKEIDAAGAKGTSSSMQFPGIVAISYCWLEPSHPDPHALTARTWWVPALQWYTSERAAVRDKRGGFYDFAVFIDYSAMPQKQLMEGGDEGPGRTPAETQLFKHGLQSLDLMCVSIYRRLYIDACS